MQMSKILVDIGHRDEHRQMVHYYFLEKKTNPMLYKMDSK